MRSGEPGTGNRESEKQERSTSGSRRFPRGVLFDLDGTLLDSAPDMLATANAMRVERGEPAMELEQLRPFVSRGSRAMVGAAFPQLDAEARAALVPVFLAIYERELGHHGAPFDGIEAMLAEIEADGGRWGIVTNKPEYLARLLMPVLGWESRCGVLIGGDTLPERKPHPMPLQHAAAALGLAPEDCVYVGDDKRDIEAARAAGMPSVVALWGYRVPGDLPEEWGGDVMVESPHDLLDSARWPARAT
ncbi:phosphoglycolate phosphatase [Luteimonas panaciterrae]|uniref:phosphoglycolate phosphatase n=1 Tax=Luteimonas panaciterrae TaxID=363885 RepID=UPI001CFA8F89|nr:phosphoglycolate phosphatase [Luteimonas panaciterrae]